MGYQKGEATKFSSEDFALIPKRGLDFSLEELFAHPFITVDRGPEIRNGKSYKMINVIPTDKRADFSIAALLIDTQNQRIVESEINSRKNGSCTMTLQNGDYKKGVPNRVEVLSKIEKIKIPLSFMAKDTEVDRTQLKSDAVKTGKIFLKLSNYRITYVNGS